MNAVSGMMLLVVPAAIWAIVTTAGSNDVDPPGDHRLQRQDDLGRDRDRVGARCGVDAWPPRPLDRDPSRSAEAISGPGRTWTVAAR